MDKVAAITFSQTEVGNASIKIDYAILICPLVPLHNDMLFNYMNRSFNFKILPCSAHGMDED